MTLPNIDLDNSASLCMNTIMQCAVQKRQTLKYLKIELEGVVIENLPEVDATEVQAIRTFSDLVAMIEYYHALLIRTLESKPAPKHFSAP